MPNSGNIPGTSLLFRATPIHEGPLRGEAKDFRSSTYNVVRADKEVILYRIWGGKSIAEGPWWTSEQPTALGPNALAPRIDYALPVSWGNTLENVNVIRVPTGTILYAGPAGPQTTKFNEHALGGKNQVLVPKSVVEGLLEYNKTGNSNTIFNVQKNFINAWEQENFNLTNASGRALLTTADQLQKLQAYANNENTIPKMGYN